MSRQRATARDLTTPDSARNQPDRYLPPRTRSDPYSAIISKRPCILSGNRVPVYQLYTYDSNKLMFACKSCADAGNVLCEALV